MTDTPVIRTTGAGSRRQVAELGGAVTRGVATALTGQDKSLHIETLRIRLPAKAGPAALERAIRMALEKERDR